MTNEIEEQTNLSPWNPVDYLRLLWKALSFPPREDSNEFMSNFLAYALMFVPLLMPLLGLTLNLVPRNELTALTPQSYTQWVIAMIVLWFLSLLTSIQINNKSNCLVVLIMVCTASGCAIGINKASSFGVWYLGLIVLSLIIANRVTNRIASFVPNGVNLGLTVGVSIIFLISLLGIVLSVISNTLLYIAIYICLFLGLLYGIFAVALDVFKAKEIPVFLVFGILILNWFALAFLSFGGLLWIL